MGVDTRDRFALGVTNCRPSAEVIRAVAEAESLGAEAAFVAEDVNCRDAFALAAVAAARTSTIRIGTGVANPYTRAPNSLAMSVATLDELSDGRAFLGLGSSSPPLIEGQLGIEYGSSLEMLWEAAAVIREFLDGGGGPVDFEGQRLKVHGAELAVPTVQGRVPIYFAAMGPRMLRLAGQVADGVLLNVGATTDYVRWAVERVHEGARAAGRDPSEITIAAWLTVYLTDDIASVLPRARAWLAGMLSIPRQGELLLQHVRVDPSILGPIRAEVSAYPHAGDPTEAGRHVPVDAVTRMALIGDRETVSERVREYRDAGVDLPVMGIAALRGLYG